MSDANRFYVPQSDLPAARPHRFGLQSVADFSRNDDPRWQNGIGWDETCGSGVGQAYVWCDPDQPVDFEKEPYEKGFGAADPFALYAMLECSMIAGQGDLAETERELVAGEYRGVERAFANKVFATATDVVPAGAPSPKAALGALLGAWTSGVEAVVHMSPNVAPFIDFTRVDDHLELSSGERVSIGYGYAEGFGGTTYDDYALFVTGPVWGYWGETVQAEAPIIVDNEHTVLTERPWLVASLCEPLRVSITGLLT